MTLIIPRTTERAARLAMFGVMIDTARESLARATFLMSSTRLEIPLSDSSETLAKSCMDLQMRVEELLHNLA